MEKESLKELVSDISHQTKTPIITYKKTAGRRSVVERLREYE